MYKLQGWLNEYGITIFVEGAGSAGIEEVYKEIIKGKKLLISNLRTGEKYIFISTAPNPYPDPTTDEIVLKEA